MNKRITSLLLCATMATTLLSGCGSTGSANATEASSTETPLTISISANAPDGTVTAFVCNGLNEGLAAADLGFNSQVYLNGTLGNDTDVAEMLLSDNVQFLCTNTANIVTMIPELAVMDMPGAFTSLEDARAAFDDPDFRAAVDAAFERVGLKLLMLGDQGFRNTSSNKKIQSVADFKGLDIRTMQNEIHMAYWKALGANPTPMNRSEVFLALQQGMLAAQEDPYVSIEANGYAEVQKYVIETNHIFSNCVLITSLDYYNSLSDKRKEAVDTICQNLLTESRAFCDQGNNEGLKKLEEQGVEYIKLTDAVYADIQKICEEKVWPLVREKAGDAIVDAMLKAKDANA